MSFFALLSRIFVTELRSAEKFWARNHTLSKFKKPFLIDFWLPVSVLRSLTAFCYLILHGHYVSPLWELSKALLYIQRQKFILVVTVLSSKHSPLQTRGRFCQCRPWEGAIRAPVVGRTGFQAWIPSQRFHPLAQCRADAGEQGVNQ